MKLSLEDKIEILRLYRIEGWGATRIAKKYHIHFSTIQRIIYRYNCHGIESLKHPPKPQKYSAEFKS